MNLLKEADDASNIGIMEFYMVGPTIADDIKQAAFWAIIGSLIVVFFIYILMRFRKMAIQLRCRCRCIPTMFFLIVLSIFSTVL